MRFNFRYMADDRRRAGASMAYGHYHQAVYGFNFLPQIRIIGGIGALFLAEFSLHIGHMNGHPGLHGLQKLIAAIEGLVHQVDSLARKTGGTRGHGPELNGWG